MKVLIKGGVWKNTEDEILKAAVMKYGKNQWARISSLLTRKTPKQCKARWFEWLDPSIKKTEWSKEEDEKLLHLAKLMPTQWRTIAPIVGRTAAQCLERYQKLLDEAEEKEGEAGPSSDDVRKLRPGEIDPDPETKPARPDPVDMDDDEKEMLSEARARLVNTQGKKAKRKAREKQLEEARRLAYLQKRRELKAAGIATKVRRRIQGVDYNADIPFYKPQPAGFWDINDEIAKEKSTKVDLTNTLLSKLNGKRSMEVESDEKKKDSKKFKYKDEKKPIVPPELIKNVQETASFSARGKLNLPAPQISELEMEQIVKLGSSVEMAKSIVQDDGSLPSSSLLGDYSSSVRGPTPLRTPRTTSNTDSIHQQALNLRAMTEAPTPLLGDYIDVRGDLDFSGVTPRRTIAATPNPLASQLTPRSGATPGVQRGRTPLRDAIGINNESSGFESTPHSTVSSVSKARLGGLFSALPKPRNEFELVLPESQDNSESSDMKSNQLVTPDAEEVAKEAREKHDRDEKIRFSRLSRAVQLNLPRPTIGPDFVNEFTSISSELESEEDVSRLIRLEKANLLIYDAVHYPSAGQTQLTLPMEDVLDLSLDLAQSLIADELKSFSPDPKTIIGMLNDLEKSTTLLFSGKTARRADLSSLSASQQLSSLKEELLTYRLLMKEKAISAQSLEKKVSIKLGGYMARSKTLSKSFLESYEKVTDARVQENAFRKLAEQEESNVQMRVWRARKELEYMVRMEEDLQNQYRQLSATSA